MLRGVWTGGWVLARGAGSWAGEEGGGEGGQGREGGLHVRHAGGLLLLLLLHGGHKGN